LDFIVLTNEDFMGRFRQTGSDEGNEAGIDMSPMMDCIFILLIFFIVTTTFWKRQALKWTSPRPPPQSGWKKPVS
jgi:biopolymer transport protein ExbD